jgi:hypothetical protein
MNLDLLALYVGPDQVMPVMSVLATIMGIVMVFWTKLKIFFARLFGMGKASAAPPPSPSVPPSAPQASVGAEPPKQS